ncbi:hypothetical protein EMIT053CA3_30240 [Pseudomonas donghuensis]
MQRVWNPPWAHSCLPGSPDQLSRENRTGQGVVAKVRYARRVVERAPEKRKLQVEYPQLAADWCSSERGHRWHASTQRVLGQTF